MGHKNARDDLPQAYLKKILDYSPDTGELRWRISMSRRSNAGDVAGWKDDLGRIKLGILGETYFAHRVIWVWMTGKWPKYEIDHINEKNWDNRFDNLREATPSENHRNRGKQRNNTTGYKGVVYDKRRDCYIAGVKLNGKRYSAGNFFETPEEAYEAVRLLAAKLHGAWSRY